MRAMQASTNSMLLSLGLASALVVGCSGHDPSSAFPGTAGSNAPNNTGGAAGAAGAAGRGGSAGAGGNGGSAGSGGTASSGRGGGLIDPGTVIDSGGGITADTACVAAERQGEQRPIALFFMMDSSASMNTRDPGQTQTRWEIISAAVPAFIGAPENAGLWAGLDFFPEPGMAGRGNNNNNASCLLPDYEAPNVPVDLLPGANNALIATAITGRTLGNGTPTTPAIQGAIVSAQAWQTLHPEQIVSVVLMTDGQPNGCNSTVVSAAAAAAAGLTGTPPIRTYVLGVGPESANLDAIAMAGGTNAAYLVTMGGAAGLTLALNAIKGTAITCDYAVPTQPGLDFESVNVQTRVGSTGDSSLIGQVADAASCGLGDGWYYDRPVVQGGPPPTSITLCPNTCDPLQQNQGSELKVLLGCKTVIAVR